MKHLNMEPEVIRRLRRRAWLERRSPMLACAVGCGAVLGMKAGGAALAAVPTLAVLLAAMAVAGLLVSRPSEKAEQLAEQINFSQICRRLGQYWDELGMWCLCAVPLSFLGLLPAVQAAGGRTYAMLCTGLACGAFAAAWRSARLSRKLEHLAALWNEEDE